MSLTTPITSKGSRRASGAADALRFTPSGPMPLAVSVMTVPTARPSGRYRRAKVSLTTTTPGAVRAVERRERAARCDLRAHRLEVAVAHAVQLRLRRIVGAGRHRLALAAGTDCASRSRAAGSCWRRRTARRAAGESRRGWPRAWCRRWSTPAAATSRAARRRGHLHGGHQHIVGLHADRCVHHVAHRAHEQRRADEQRARERDLGGDQHRVDLARASRAAALARLQVGGHRSFQQEHRRQQAEEDGGHRHDDEAEAKRAQVHAGLVQPRDVHRHQPHDQRQGRGGGREARARPRRRRGPGSRPSAASRAGAARRPARREPPSRARATAPA